MSKNLERLFGEKPISINCEHCGKEIDISFSDIGSSVEYPNCSSTINIVLSDDSDSVDNMDKSVGELFDLLDSF